MLLFVFFTFSLDLGTTTAENRALHKQSHKRSINYAQSFVARYRIFISVTKNQMGLSQEQN